MRHGSKSATVNYVSLHRRPRLYRCAPLPQIIVEGTAGAHSQKRLAQQTRPPWQYIRGVSGIVFRADFFSASDKSRTSRGRTESPPTYCSTGDSSRCLSVNITESVYVRYSHPYPLVSGSWATKRGECRQSNHRKHGRA